MVVGLTDQVAFHFLVTVLGHGQATGAVFVAMVAIFERQADGIIIVKGRDGPRTLDHAARQAALPLTIFVTNDVTFRVHSLDRFYGAYRARVRRIARAREVVAAKARDYHGIDGGTNFLAFRSFSQFPVGSNFFAKSDGTIEDDVFFVASRRESWLAVPLDSALDVNGIGSQIGRVVDFLYVAQRVDKRLQIGQPTGANSRRFGL